MYWIAALELNPEKVFAGASLLECHQQAMWHVHDDSEVGPASTRMCDGSWRPSPALEELNSCWLKQAGRGG